MATYRRDADVSQGAHHEWATRFSPCPECGDDESADQTEDTDNTTSTDDTACIECAGTKRLCEWCRRPPTTCTCEPEHG